MGIKELKKQRQVIAKPKKTQWYFAIMLLFGMIVLYKLYLSRFRHGWILFIGIVAGYSLQRSKLCFTASIRDVLLFRKTKVFRALLWGIIVATVGFGFKQQQAINLGLPIPGQIESVGIHTALGGILFGIGMVIAGSCISGAFTRIGEGYLVQWVTLIGIFIGTGLAIATFELWFNWFMKDAKVVYFGDYLPLPILIILQVIALGLLMRWAYAFEKKQK